MSASQRFRLAGVLLLCAAALGMLGGGGFAIPGLTPKVTAVTYVYEKDDTAIPNGVLAAFDKLNRQGIVANPFEQDTVDGSGETPEQYKAALAAAKEVGLPALVATAGDRVVRTVKSPTTEEATLEVAQ